MNRKQLETWWDGLSEAERAEALKSGDAGRLDAATRRSLEDSGVVDKGLTSDDAALFEFLKMRH
jgi:hypothetical protein